MNNQDKINEIKNTIITDAGVESPAVYPAPDDNEDYGYEIPSKAIFIGRLNNPLASKDKASYAKKYAIKKHIVFKEGLLECYYNEYSISLYTHNYNEFIQELDKKHIKRLSLVDHQFKKHLEEEEYNFCEDISDFLDLFGHKIGDWGMATPDFRSERRFLKALFTECLLRNLPVYPDLSNETQTNAFKCILSEIRVNVKRVYCPTLTKEQRVNHFHCAKIFMKTMGEKKGYYSSSAH